MLHICLMLRRMLRDEFMWTSNSGTLSSSAHTRNAVSASLRRVSCIDTGRVCSIAALPDSEGGNNNMPLLQVVIALIVVGVLLWLVNRFIPMAGSIKSILNAVVVIAVVLWLLNIFGLLQSLSNIHVGKT